MVNREIVAKFKLFNGLSPGDLDKVLSCGKEIDFKQDQVIVKESGFGQNLFLILSGQVAVELKLKLPDGRVGLATLGEGDIFGESCFLEEKPRGADVAAITDVRALRLEIDALKKVLEEDTQTGFMVMRNLCIILSQRLCETNIKLREND